MNEEARPVFGELVRQRAASFLRERDDNIRRRWRGLLEAAQPVDDSTPFAQLIGDLTGFFGPLVTAIADDEDDPRREYLATLAEQAYRLGVPYARISRSLRLLKRLLMRLVVQNLEPDAGRDAICDVIEEEIDESRVLVNQFYHTFHEALLRRSEGLNRFLLNNVYDAVMLLESESGQVVMGNARALVLTGYSQDELTSGSFARLVAEEHRQTVAEALRQVKLSGALRHDDLGVQTREGEIRPVQMQFTRVPAGEGGPLVQVTIRDAAGMETFADDPETAYLRAFVTDTADAVLVLDLDERIRSWNKGAEQIFGYTFDEMLNRPVSDLLPREVIEAGELHYLAQRLDSERFVRNYETRRRTKDGRRIDVEITRTAIHDPRTGKRLGTSAVVRDITEKKQLQREAQEKTRQLEIINEILEATSRSLDREETFRTIAGRMRELLPCDAMIVSLLEREQHRFRCRVLVGDGRLAEGGETVVDTEHTLQTRAMESAQAIVIDDLKELTNPLSHDRSLIDFGFRSALVTALICGNQVLGTLMVLHHRPGQYSPVHCEQLHHLGNHIAVVLENGRRYEEERRRAAQFELISHVGASAIASIGDVKRLMSRVVDSIQTDFGFYDVAIYEVDEDADAFRLRAQAGPRRGKLADDYEQPLEVGVFGKVLREQCSYVCGDTLLDPIYFDPQPGRTNVRSELCVPIRLGPRVFGVLDVESQRPNRFDALDRAAMEVLAGLLARCMEADESLRQTRMLQAMRHNIMESVPSALILLDDQLRVKFVNKRYLEFFGQTPGAIMNRAAEEVFPPKLLEESRFEELVEQIKHDKKPIDQREVRYVDFHGNERYADVRLRLVTEYETTLIVMLHDATNRLTRLYQLSMLQEIGEEMQRTLDSDRLLLAILTCVTAGPGFGFNRAALFLHDAERGLLVERLRVGPHSAEEAGEIWQQLGHKKSVREILREYDGDARGRGELPGPANEIEIPVEDADLHGWRTPLMLRADEHDPRPVGAALRAYSGAPELLVVPLVSQETVLGLVVADNLFTREPISLDSIRMLSTFANQAGVALANAQAFEQLATSLEALRKAQAELSRAERLAGIGSVAAHVAHEIRNPLVSIGGFARRLEKHADRPDPEYVRTRTQIIVKEVQRLEQILRNVADFTAPGAPHLGPVEPNAVIEDVLGAQQPVIEESQIDVETDLADDLPVIQADRGKLVQVVLNLVRNALQAMDGRGTLRLRTARTPDGNALIMEVADDGPGIPKDRLEEIFNPFFTNKADGTGLGLAVSRKIVTDHGGELTVESQPGEGATFTVRLPLADK